MPEQNDRGPVDANKYRPSATHLGSMKSSRPATRLPVRLNLARHLRLGYHGSWWTDKERRLLGKLPDTEVARRIGRIPTAVRIKREALAIANAPVRWSITYCGELWAAQQGSEANYGYARDVDRRWSTNFFPTG